MKTLNLLLLLTFVCLTFSGIAGAEVLHKWLEPNPYHSYTYGNTDENLFYTYTTKDASRSESGGSWQVTGSATASANAHAPLPRGEDRSTEFDVDAQLRATGDRHEVDPFHGNELPETADGVEKTKKSSDGTTTARTKRKAHVVHYRNKTFGQADQRSLNTSTSGGKSETSVSPTDLDADPWASSWLEVKRRVALNNDIPGSPFESATPECSSSGNGHTCEGYVSPEKKKEVGHCERKSACLTPETSVKNRPKAHVIKCPEQTYKQGIARWLMLKWKEDCKGEKWSCHNKKDNCSRKHLHLKPASEASSGETVVNGYVVPAGYSVGTCGEHLYPSSESASDHAWGTPSCGDSTHADYLCQITASDHEWVYESCPSLHARYECDGTDHSLQASCSSTDSNGNTCTVTNFYACDNHSPVYPISTPSTPPTPPSTPSPPSTPPPPPPPSTVRCGRSACTTSVSSSNEHLGGPCASGHTYWSCNPNVNVSNWQNKHRVRTCRYEECGQSWQRCQTSTPICNKPYRKRNGLKCWAVE